MATAMAKSKLTKRENFDVSPDQQAEIEALQDLLGVPSRKEALLYAVHLALHVASEVRNGNEIYICNSQKRDYQRLRFFEIERPELSKWKFLAPRSHPWRKQLYVKGRRLKASDVWSSMVVNKMSREETAQDWDLPLDAVDEIIEYCEENRKLLEMEAEEEKRLLAEKGIIIDSPNSRR